MKKFKWISLSIAIVALASVLAACGNNNDNSNASSSAPSSAGATETATDKASEPAKSNVTLSLTTAAGDTWLRQIDKDIIADFTKETGIKVDVQIIPPDQYANVLKTKFASGEGPDISLVWAEANAAQFLPDTNFLDLTSEPWVSEMTDAAKKNSTYNGKVIGWGPAGEDSGWGVMYNKEIFSKLGLEVPKTYEEFLAVCDKILASGVTPVYEPLKDTWHSGIWLTLMGPIGNKNLPGLYEGLNDGTKGFAASKEFDTFLNQYKTMYDKGYFGKEALSNTFDKGTASLQSGKYAMFMVPANWDVQAKGSNPDFDFTKFAEFPAPFNDNQMLAFYDGTIIRVINQKSENVDAAKQYLNYISRPDVLKKYYDATGLNPAFKSFPAVQSDLEKTLRSNSDGTNDTIMETGIKFWDGTSFGNYIQEFLLGGKTSRQVLEAIDKDRERLFSVQANSQ